jgi:hypothetical protein
VENGSLQGLDDSTKANAAMTRIEDVVLKESQETFEPEGTSATDYPPSRNYKVMQYQSQNLAVVAQMPPM